MRTLVELTRTGESTSPPVFVRIPEPKGRPPLRFRLRIESEKDAKVARRHRLPVYWLDAATVTALGYPMTFPPMILTTERLRDALDTRRAVLVMRSEEALLHPRFEDVAIALLLFDAMAARAVIERNKDEVDCAYLSRRLIEESLVEVATAVRFFDSVRGVPAWGQPLPKVAVDRKIHKNPPMGRL